MEPAEMVEHLREGIGKQGQVHSNTLLLWDLEVI